MPKRRVAAIALGSNLGDREEKLYEAIGRVAELGRVVALSSFHDTAPVGYLEQPRFLNGVVILETELAPLALLRKLLKIELAMGRDRAAVAPKGPRTIDLDLVFCDDQLLHSAELTLPHPAMHQRRFVLAPLAEVAPAWRHPILRRTVLELLSSITD